MKRRNFIIAGLAAAGAFILGLSEKDRIRRSVRNIYQKTRPTYRFPKGYETVSVETVLNSRCNSDWGGNPHEFHWGMFDRNKRLSPDVVEQIVALSRVPRLAGSSAAIAVNSETLTFVVPNVSNVQTMSLQMIQSGMQQQAVGLACAALGVGMVFDNRGRDGVAISGTDFLTTTIKLGPMKPGYDGAYWTSEAPDDPCPWLTGNLADPQRRGDNSFLSLVPEPDTRSTSSHRASEGSLSQLLWAARGRTPHYYLGRPWGLTIPTRGGHQNISSVYVIQSDKSFRYVNSKEDRPAHMLQELAGMKEELSGDISAWSQSKNGLIVIGTNEDRNWALWEVGYQLFNLLVQAKSLGISYKTFFLDETQQEQIEQAGIKNPVVAFA